MDSCLPVLKIVCDVHTGHSFPCIGWNGAIDGNWNWLSFPISISGLTAILTVQCCGKLLLLMECSRYLRLRYIATLGCLACGNSIGCVLLRGSRDICGVRYSTFIWKLYVGHVDRIYFRAGLNPPFGSNIQKPHPIFWTISEVMKVPLTIFVLHFSGPYKRLASLSLVNSLILV